MAPDLRICICMPWELRLHLALVLWGDIAFIGLGNAVHAVPTRPTGRLSERFFSSITQNKTLYCFHKIKRFIVFIK